jgi:hypothetical protein|tara:strand:- start:21414 stop:21662 length:249 start_codon:yes stop_codon:yes gene_type:complete
MKTDFTMKMAGTKYEAIKVILETLENNAVWLNKCESSLFALVYSMHVTKERERWLKLCTTQQIKDLYIEIRTQYYNATDIKF